ncbi:hypothetical protein [Bacillus sp. NEB1478]|uniref:hypothetical protein n=1 Tax=Bacillus sp. NEB1478 TaxID=3073816 RepID=UPI0028732B99|nr:hypothetical protein [Bacillus sp. NEB1478]WNB90863.1 hypothetical protein RGB74_13185 [Bacillus sp. NEB1478]
MRWVMGVAFSLLGVALLMTGMNVRSLSEIEGDGIGISFLGMKINGSVAAADIPSYANGFLGSGTIFLILAVCLFFILLNEKNVHKQLRVKK